MEGFKSVNFLAQFVAGIAPYIMAILGFLAAIATIFYRGKSAGRAEVETRAAKDQLEGLKERNTIDDEVTRAGDDAVTRELREWADPSNKP